MVHRSAAPSPVRRVALILILVIGVVLLLFPFVTGLFGKTASVEKLTGDFRTTFTDSSLAQTRSDFDGITAMADQLQGETLPALPGALGMTDKQFAALVHEEFPDVEAGLVALPEILPRFEQLVGGLEDQQENFEQADSIPTGWLPSTVVPWLLIVPGLALVVLAGLALRGRETRKVGAAALVASVVVGVVLAGAAVALNIQAKGKAVDDLTAALEPFFTEEGAAKTQADLATVGGLSEQFQRQTVPTLAKALGMNRKQFNAFLEKNYPDVATGVASLDTVLPRFQAAGDAVSDNVESFADVASIPTGNQPTTAVFWWFLLPGLALILLPLLVRLTASPAADDGGQVVRGVSSGYRAAR